MNCCFCGPVKNCGTYLNKVFENVEKLGSLFNDYQIIIYYDESTDDTLQKLIKYQEKNPKLSFYVNQKPISKFRTQNLAIARNWCLNYVRQNKEYFPFFFGGTSPLLRYVVVDNFQIQNGSNRSRPS